MANVLDSLLRVGEGRVLRKLEGIAREVNALEPDYQQLSDEELKDETRALRERYGAGETLDDLLPEAFAAVRSHLSFFSPETTLTVCVFFLPKTDLSLRLQSITTLSPITPLRVKRIARKRRKRRRCTSRARNRAVRRVPFVFLLSERARESFPVG